VRMAAAIERHRHVKTVGLGNRPQTPEHTTPRTKHAPRQIGEAAPPCTRSASAPSAEKGGTPLEN
jgi:hypothetical protein